MQFMLLPPRFMTVKFPGEISRGYEKVQRIYVASYEDENKILHEAHNLYVVVKPAEWTFHNTLHGKGGE